MPSHRPRPGQSLVEYALIAALCAVAFVGILAVMGAAAGATFQRVQESVGDPGTPVPTATPGPPPPPTNTPTPGPTPTPTNTPTPAPTPTATATPCVTITVTGGPSVTVVPSGSKHDATITWTASIAGPGRVAVSRPNQPITNPLSGSPFAAGSGTAHSATVTSLNSGTYQYRLEMQNACSGAWDLSGVATFVVP